MSRCERSSPRHVHASCRRSLAQPRSDVPAVDRRFQPENAIRRELPLLCLSELADKQEIILHALHESGQIQLQDLEAHIKDDIEREGGKITEMTRKVKQAYKEVVSFRIYIILAVPDS